MISTEVKSSIIYSQVQAKPLQEVTIDRFTAIALYAILKVSPYGTRMGIEGHQLTLQLPCKYQWTVPYFGYSFQFDTQSAWRWWWSNGRNETAKIHEAVKEGLAWYQISPAFRGLLPFAEEGAKQYHDFYRDLDKETNPVTISLECTEKYIRDAKEMGLKQPYESQVESELDKLKDRVRRNWTEAEMKVVLTIVELAHKKFNNNKSAEPEVRMLLTYLCEKQKPVLGDLQEIAKYNSSL